MKITIIGCGNMGMIYARAFLKYDIADKNDLLLVAKNEKHKQDLIQMNAGQVTLIDDPRIGNSEIIIISVKPQDFHTIAGDLKKVLNPGNTIISIMAGMKISKIIDALGQKNLVRAMPNSPAELGMGMTSFTASNDLPLDKIRRAENLLATTGRTVFFEDEQLLDAATALSGSGPAYFFYLVKYMIEAGKEMGFNESTATMLVKQTMVGAFHLINNATKSLDELMETVASKGGTTHAAFKVFNEKKLGEILEEGILKACERSKELSA